jgi:hypothetical protein
VTGNKQYLKSREKIGAKNADQKIQGSNSKKIIGVGDGFIIRIKKESVPVMTVISDEPLVIIFRDGNNEARIAQISHKPAEIIAAELEHRDVQAAKQEQQCEPVILEIFFEFIQ